MIGPVYSHLKEWEQPGQKRKPIAIFQFINKKEYKPITEYDVVSITNKAFRKNSKVSLTCWVGQ